MTGNDVLNFKYAPPTFFMYKNLLSYNLRSFKLENIKKKRLLYNVTFKVKISLINILY